MSLRFRNPLPFADVGSRMFSATSPAAKETILVLLAQHGVRERFQADTSGVLHAEPKLPIAFVVSDVFAGTVLNLRKHGIHMPRPPKR